VREHGKLASSEVLRIARQICQGLAYAHARGVVHRDLKPSNLFRLPDGSIKLLDFGLARDEDNTQMSLSGVGMGTLDYAAPEQRDDASKADARSDLYSLGATLYYLATGKSPKVVRERDLPDELRTLVLGLMEDQPSARPQTIQAAVDAISAAERSSELAPAMVEGDDLRCPKCKAANSLEAKVCRSCEQSLRVKCPACNAEHRLGLAHCDQCGASGFVVRKAQRLLSAIHSARTEGRLEEADACVRELSSLLADARLGAKSKALPSEAQEESRALAQARRDAQALLRKASELSAKGHAQDAIAQFDQAARLDCSIGAAQGAVRNGYVFQAQEIVKRLAKVRSALARAEEACKAGELAEAERFGEDARRLIELAPSGDVSEPHDRLVRLQERVQSSRSRAASLRRRAEEEERAARHESALASALGAMALDHSLAAWMAELEARQPALLEQRRIVVASAQAELREIESLVQSGRLRDAEARLASGGALSGEAQYAREACDKEWNRIEQEIARRRTRVQQILREAEQFRSVSKHEDAQRLLAEADLLECGLSAVEEATSELPALIVARDEAVALAKTAAADACRVSGFGSITRARRSLREAQARLERDAPGIQVDELVAERVRLDRVRSRRKLALAMSLLTLLAAAVAWIWQSARMRSMHSLVVTRYKQLESKARSQGGEWSDSALVYAKSELEPSLASAERAAKFGLWWREPELSQQVESDLSVLQSMLDLQGLQVSYDPVVAQFVESRRAEFVRSFRFAVESRNTATMRSLSQAYRALVIDASAISDVAPCVDPSRLEPVLASWQSAVAADDVARAESAKREILEFAEAGICTWAETLVAAPDASIITDQSTRERIITTELPWRVKDRATGIEMVLIPSGKYMRGASPGDSEAFNDERPPHEVVITKSFYLGVYEVTQSEWQKLMGSNPSHFKGARLPVESVSWNDTQEFLGKSKGLRLPTEGEWEYACRAGTTGSRYGDLDQVAWHGNNSGGTAHAVGSKQPNGFGLHDMLGNVREWCSDWYGAYPGGSEVDPSGPSSWKNPVFPDSEEYRVFRGGSRYSQDSYCRASDRGDGAPADGNDGLGFRVARTP
jgi:formylglycine-generating enzyme required for sulfatase activity